MKNTIKFLTTILLLVMTINCSAQHVTDPTADKFAGTWKWGDDVNGLVIIMKKENNVKPFGNNKPQTWDGIVGFQKLMKNGFMIDDYLSFSNTNFLDRKYSFVGSTNTNIQESSPNELLTWGRHKGKSIQMKIEYIDFTYIKVIEVQNMEGVWARTENQPPRDLSIDIPVNIILTKQ